MTNFIISLCLISIVFGISSGFSKESTLKKSLLEYYDPTTKPEGQTTVEISVRPVNMKMCPKSQVLTLHTWNMYKWKDLRLTWNPEYFDNITTLFINRAQIWAPSDIVVYNSVEQVEQIMNEIIIVSHDGSMLMVPSEIHKIFCKVDYSNWPFGPQKCDFKIGSWYHGLTKIDVKDWVPEGDESEHFWNNQYEVSKLDVSRHEQFYPCCPSEPYPHLLVNFEFQQKMAFQDGELKN